MAGNTISNLHVGVTFDGSQAVSGISKLSSKFEEFGADSEKHFEKFRKLGEIIGKLGSGGGFSIAGLASAGVAIGKMVADGVRLAAEFEKAGANIENMKKAAEEMAAQQKNWDQMGVVGKATSIPSEIWSGLTSGLGQTIKTFGEFVDQLTGAGSALDNFRDQMASMAQGEIGPISAFLNSVGLKDFNDWTDRIVGAEDSQGRANRKNQQADVLAREKRIGAERIDYENRMEDLRKSLGSETQTEEEKFANSIRDLDKIISEVVNRRGGAEFADVAMLAEKRKAQLIEEQNQKLADAAQKQADEQQKIIEAQQRTAEAAQKAAQQLAQELENLVSSVRTPSEQFSASLAEFNGLLAEALAAGDQTRAEVYRRRIGKLGAGMLANVPEFTTPDPFAGVSLAGSQEFYRDSIRAQFPPEQLSIQERMATALDDMNRRSEEELATMNEVLRVLSGQAGPKLAHMF